MKLKQFIFALVAMLSGFAFTANAQVAKVGNTEYATIDEAIANWTNGTTLTLLSDVKLTKVISLNSNEYHILDLSTFTMTAAKNKNAIEYVVKGRSSAGYALDIKADATNPGGITATGKAIITHTKPLISAPSKDRPITRFYGGVFNASNIVKQGGTFGAGYTGASAPCFYFYGGEFNGTIYTNRSIVQFHGGTFNGRLQMSVDSSSWAMVAGGRFKNLSNDMGSELNSDKFAIGSAKGTYNRGIYVDAEGYYVVTTDVITEVSAKYPAVKKESYNSNNYFYYSAAATYGMFYEVASMAGTGDNVTIWEKPAVTITIPEDVTGESTVVEEIKNNTVLEDYTPENLPEDATLEIVLESVGETIVYDVAPMVDGVKVEPTEAITFRLPVPASVTAVNAKVYHEGTLMGVYEIKGEGNAKYVEVSSADFSEFAVEPVTVYEVATYEALVAALANDGAVVKMTADITATATQSSGYGKAGIVVDAGDILDGNGKKLTINDANATWDCVIAMRGGEVKNLTIAGAMRGVFMPGANGDVVIDNCVFENVIYTFNSDAGSKDYTVTIKNTTINGWTSFSDVHESVTFESCTFGEGSGYAFCRPYQATTFVDCAFAAGYKLDTKQTATNTLVFNECTYNGAAISSDNNAMFYNGGSVVIDGEVADVTQYAAKVGTDKYLTLAEAVAAAEAGATIELLTDVEESACVVIGKSLTINGNGHKVTSTATRVFRVTASNIEVTLNNVNMVSRTVMTYPNDIRGISIDPSLQNVKLTLNNSSVDFTDASACDWAYAVNVSGNGTGHTVTVNGGSYEGANVINAHGANNTIVVKDATLTSLYPNNDVYYGACIWVLQNQGSSVEATGNTFIGENAIAFNVGTGTTVEESANVDNTGRIIGNGTEANPYLITNVNQFVAFRNSVNAGETKYNAEGVYVALGADIDLTGIDWSVNIGDDCNATFDGIFDGKNFTISNLTAVETAKKGDGFICAGLFGAIYGNAVVKNLTIENVTIDAPFAGNNIAAVVGFAYSAKGSIENVKVIGDININAPLATGVGAIVGYDYYSPALKVVNCEVKGNDGSAIVAKSYAGALVGYASSEVAINNNTVENINVTATGSVGAVAGIMLGGSSADANTIKNVALSATGELWANSAAVVAGTISGGAVTVANTTVENVTANGAEAVLVGGQLVEKPTTAIAKVEARIGNKYYATFANASAAVKADETIVLLANAEVVADATITLNGVDVTSVENATLTNNGTINLGINTLIAASVAGNGTINVDATGVEKSLVVIEGDMSGFTGTIEVANGYHSIEDEGLVVFNNSYIKEYIFDDANSVDYTFTEEKNVGTLTLKRTLIPGIWNPLYLPFAIPVEDLIDNYDIAYYNQMHSVDTNNDGLFDSYTMEVARIKAGTLKANYPYFIRPKTADDCNLEYVAENVTLSPAVEKKVVTSSVANIFTLSGTHKAMDENAIAGCYAVSVDGDWALSAGVKAHRLYLKIEDNDNSPFATTRAKSIRIVTRGENEGTTGVEEVESVEGENVIYDLSGRRVLEAVKGGIYIVNGKKVLVK